MSATVVLLPKPPDRECPKCGYVMSQKEVDLARFDFPCPNCLNTTLKDFKRLVAS